MQIRHTFAGMEKQLTPEEAFYDFWNWFKSSEGWSELSRAEKHYIYVAKYAYDKGKLGYTRVKNILEKHAPDRYEFRRIVILKT